MTGILDFIALILIGLICLGIVFILWALWVINTDLREHEQSIRDIDQAIAKHKSA